MPTETLHFESARAAQQLYNNDPRNLQALADQLGVKATSREGWIKLDGESEALERVKHLFLVLENSIKAGTPVRNREFSHALSIVQQEGVSTLKDIMNDRIQTSDKKSGVTAKTVGQKKYLDAIRHHDVTIGVGPAGTGKTYLAVAMALAALRAGQVSRIILTRPASRPAKRSASCRATFTRRSCRICAPCTTRCTTCSPPRKSKSTPNGASLRSRRSPTCVAGR